MNIRKAGQEEATSWSFRAGVGIDVKFGMAKYNCRFHGICRLDIDESDLQLPLTLKCGRGKGRLFIPRPDYGLICFEKSSMTEATRQAHFQQEYFVLEEAVGVSEKLAIHLERSFYLAPGKYRIMEKENGYCVLFEIMISSTIEKNSAQ